MGQQQLLLVILVTVIVGIATVVAINTFGSASKSAAQDAVVNDIASIASGAQGYVMKPAMLGGGEGSFSEIKFSQLPFAFDKEAEGTTDLIVFNLNGKYTITPGDETFTIEGYNENYGFTCDATVGKDGITEGPTCTDD